MSDYGALQQFFDSGASVTQTDIAKAQTPLTLASYSYLWKWFIGKDYSPDHAWPNYYSAASEKRPPRCQELLLRRRALRVRLPVLRLRSGPSR